MVEGHNARKLHFVHTRNTRSIAALALLLVLAFPVTSLKLGFPDAGNDPKGTTTRQAYDMLAKGFGPGANGPPRGRLPGATGSTISTS